MDMSVPAGSTSVIAEFKIFDRGTDSEGLAGLAHNTTNLIAYYHRESAGPDVQIPLIDMTLGTWASGGFKEVDAATMKGVYQLGLPDAIFASGAKRATILLSGAENMVAKEIRIDLTDQTYDLLNADIVVDVETDPDEWRIHFKQAGTETILATKLIKDLAGNPLASLATKIGQFVSE